MSALTPSQQSTLEAFTKDLYDRGILHDGDTIVADDVDYCLTRFLRARQFNVKAATKMFEDCQNWRKSVEGMGIDELYKQMDPMDYPERKDVFDCWPLWYHHLDKRGRPLNIHFFGDLDMPKLYKSCSPQQHWRSILVNAESLTREILPAASRKVGKRVPGVFVIVDLKGFSVSKFWQMKSLARDSFQISQDYYPETMGSLYVVNAPSSFATIYSVLKPWLAEETKNKIEILGSNYKDVLLNLVDADSLPKDLGGNCTCKEYKDELEEDGLKVDGKLEGLRCRYSAAGPWREGRQGWGPKSQKKQTQLQEEKPSEQPAESESKPEVPVNQTDVEVMPN